MSDRMVMEHGKNAMSQINYHSRTSILHYALCDDGQGFSTKQIHVRLLSGSCDMSKLFPKWTSLLAEVQ